MRQKDKKRLKKQITGMAALGICVVVLLCVLILLQGTGNKDGSSTGTADSPAASSSSASSELAEVLNKKVTDITSVTVKNRSGGYTIRSSGQSYTVDELSGLPENASAINFVLQNSLSTATVEDVGKVDALQEFGLLEPAATVTLHFLDGSGFVYYLGDMVDPDDETMYMCAQGSDYVYVVNADTRLLEDCTVFVGTSVLSLNSSQKDNSDPLFSKITVSGSAFPDDIVITRANTKEKYRMTQPLSTDCDTAAVTALTAYLTDLSAQRAVAIHPDDSQLAQFGLQPAGVRIEYTYNGVDYRLSASVKDSTTYYVKYDGLDVIYEVSSDYIKTWAQTSSFTLRNKKVLQFALTDIHVMDVQTAQNCYTLTSTRTLDEFKSTEKKPAYTYAVTAGGKAVSTSNFQNFLSVLGDVSLTADPPQQTCTQSPVFTMTYAGFTDDAENTVRLIPYNQTQLFLVINDQIMGLISQTDAQLITAAADHLTD